MSHALSGGFMNNGSRDLPFSSRITSPEVVSEVNYFIFNPII